MKETITDKELNNIRYFLGELRIMYINEIEKGDDDVGYYKERVDILKYLIRKIGECMS